MVVLECLAISEGVDIAKNLDHADRHTCSMEPVEMECFRTASPAALKVDLEDIARTSIKSLEIGLRDNAHAKFGIDMDDHLR